MSPLFERQIVFLASFHSKINAEKSFFNSRQDDKCICDHLDNGLELAIVEIGHLIVLHKRKMSIL